MTENTEKLYIVMPAYNEAEGIAAVIKEWYPKLSYGTAGSRLVIADGGSTDHTYDILRKLQKQYPDLEVLSRPGTTHGTKVRFLYQYAIDHHADWIFMSDSDGQTEPAEFDRFWKKRKRYDCVIGNRADRKDGRARRFVDFVLRCYLFIFFRSRVPDGSAPFRLMKTELVAEYIDVLPKLCMLPNAVLNALFVQYKHAVIFEKITFRKREHDKSKVRIREVLELGLRSVPDFYLISRNAGKIQRGKEK